jgi:hypothetical protein
MKGQLWDIVLLILILGFLIFLLSQIFLVTGEVFKIDAVINSEKVTGIINILLSSPAETTQKYYLPDGVCSLNIKYYGGLTLVNFTSNNRGVVTSAITEPLITDIVVNDADIICDEKEEKKIFFKRCADEIKIFESMEQTC